MESSWKKLYSGNHMLIWEHKDGKTLLIATWCKDSLGSWGFNNIEIKKVSEK